jgi:hypothetical protein
MLTIAITAVATAGVYVTAKNSIEVLAEPIIDAVHTHRMAKLQRELETRLVTRAA